MRRASAGRPGPAPAPLPRTYGAFPCAGGPGLLGVEIIKAFIARPRERHDNTREVAPLTSGKPVWRLSRGHDHRGATWFDRDDKVFGSAGLGTSTSTDPRRLR